MPLQSKPCACVQVVLGRLVLEDESRMVGSCTVPLELFNAMQSRARWSGWRTVSEHRVGRILGELNCDGQCSPVRCAFAAANPEQGVFGLCRTPTVGLLRIRKRRGGERFQQP